MSIARWFWHAITGCPKSDLVHTIYGTTYCRTCGRVAFVSDDLPKITRLKTTSRFSYR